MLRQSDLMGEALSNGGKLFFFFFSSWQHRHVCSCMCVSDLSAISRSTSPSCIGPSGSHGHFFFSIWPWGSALIQLCSCVHLCNLCACFDVMFINICNVCVCPWGWRSVWACWCVYVHARLHRRLEWISNCYIFDTEGCCKLYVTSLPFFFFLTSPSPFPPPCPPLLLVHLPSSPPLSPLFAVQTRTTAAATFLSSSELRLAYWLVSLVALSSSGLTCRATASWIHNSTVGKQMHGWELPEEGASAQNTMLLFFFFCFCNVIRGYSSIVVWLEFPTRYEQLNCWAAAIYLVSLSLSNALSLFFSFFQILFIIFFYFFCLFLSFTMP